MKTPPESLAVCTARGPCFLPIEIAPQAPRQRELKIVSATRAQSSAL